MDSPSPKRVSIAARRSSAVERITANTDLTEEERVQIERIAKNRPPQNTLSTDESSLARYEVVTFGIKDEAYYNSSGIVVIERAKSTASSSDDMDAANNSGRPLVRKQSIIRQPAATADAAGEEKAEAVAVDALADAPKECSSPSFGSLSRSASRKAVKFTGGE